MTANSHEKFPMLSADREENPPSLEDFCQVLSTLPCACYLISPNSDLTVEYANAAFYQLLDCPKEELHSRYGNRLAALASADSLAPLLIFTRSEGMDGGMSFDMRVRRGEEIYWLRTQIHYLEFESRRLLSCVSYDVSAQRALKEELGRYRNTIARITTLTRNEIFEYDPRTKRAVVHSAFSLLNQVSEEEQKRYGGFAAALLAKGMVDEKYVPIFEDTFQNTSRGTLSSCELRMRPGEDKPYIWVRLSLDSRGEGEQAVGLLQDITQNREASLRYLTETQFFQAMLTEKDAYAQVDVTMDKITRIGGMWNLYNEIIDRITYSQLIEEFIFKVVHPQDRRHYLELMQSQNFVQSLENGIDRLSCQFRRIVEQNKMTWMELGVHLFRDLSTQHVLALLYIKNIDEQKRRELRELHEGQQLHNTTTVLTPVVAEQYIRRCLSEAVAADRFALLIVSVDGGEALAARNSAQLAHYLLQLLRREDIVCTQENGDYLLFLQHPGEQQNVEKILSRLSELLATQLEYPFTCSCGITYFAGETEFDAILHQAALALSAARGVGNSTHRFYTPEMGSAAAPVLLAERAPALPPTLVLPTRPEAQDSTQEDGAFEALLGVQGDIAYLVDTYTYELVLGNAAFYGRLGLTKSQCVGAKCYELMQNRESPCPFCGRANWSRDKFYLWRNQNAHLEQEFLIKNKLVTWNGQEVLLAIAVDISNNKSIVDSLETQALESHTILIGIQRMTEAPDRMQVMNRALENFAYFFRADAAQFWELSAENDYSCTAEWKRSPEFLKDPRGRALAHTVNAWMRSREWIHPLDVESPESMLVHSYEMYQLMQESSIHNQRWIPLWNKRELLGVIVLANISSNYQNISFTQSFTGYIASEWDRRALMEELLYANSHDELTNLLSRSSYEQYLHSYDPDKLQSIGVLTADINDLKGINRRQNYQTGDLCIKQFATMLLSLFPEGSGFRINGDEFLVVFPNVTWAEMAAKEEELAALVAKENLFTVSTGMAWDNIEKELRLLIDQATQACKVNKKRYYDALENAPQDNRRSTMLQEVMEGIAERRYLIYLQPKVDMSTGDLIGAEALIRYRDPVQGLIPPAQFIDQLERNNFIRYIDLFVFEEVCRLLTQWQGAGLPCPTVSLNFSRLTLLEHGIRASVETIHRRYPNAPREKLEIEVTESMADMGKSVLFQAARELNLVGYPISLDDFGTKYTNLSILTELDFDMLKVDKSLISALSKQWENRIVLKNVIAMCQDLGIHVIAEGVETKEQEEILLSLGCRYAQGYLYGKPLPVEEFVERYLKG